MASEIPVTAEVMLKTDASKQFLGSLLGQGWDAWGQGLGGSAAAELMLQLFSAFNIVALAVISGLFIWVLAVAVAGTAHEGGALCRGKVNAVGAAISALSSTARQLADPDTPGSDIDPLALYNAANQVNAAILSGLQSYAQQGQLQSKLKDFEEISEQYGWFIAGSSYWSIAWINQEAREAMYSGISYTPADEHDHKNRKHHFYTPVAHADTLVQPESGGCGISGKGAMPLRRQFWSGISPCCWKPGASVEGFPPREKPARP